MCRSPRIFGDTATDLVVESARSPHHPGRRRHRPLGAGPGTHDQPIPGLYAAGGTACGLAGPSSDGYGSGNGLLSALGMGWTIGNSLTGTPAH